MNRVAFAFSTVALSFGFGAAGVAAQTSTMSGKLVDIATYITHDHNMDSMHAMSGGAMSGDHMMAGASAKDDHMSARTCPTLGLVTSLGRVYLVATQMGASNNANLCKKINTAVTLSGKVYSQGGMNVLLTGG